MSGFFDFENNEEFLLNPHYKQNQVNFLSSSPFLEFDYFDSPKKITQTIPGGGSQKAESRPPTLVGSRGYRLPRKYSRSTCSTPDQILNAVGLIVIKPHLDEISGALIEQQQADIKDFNTSVHANIEEDQIKFQNQLDFEIISQIHLYSKLSRLQPPSFDRSKPGKFEKRLKSEERFAFAEAARELVVIQYPEYANLPLSQNPLYSKYWDYLKKLEKDRQDQVFSKLPEDATLVNFHFCHKYSVTEDRVLHSKGEGLYMNQQAHFDQAFMAFALTGDYNSFQQAVTKIKLKNFDRDETVNLLIRAACQQGITVDRLLEILKTENDNFPRNIETMKNRRVINGNLVGTPGYSLNHLRLINGQFQY